MKKIVATLTIVAGSIGVYAQNANSSASQTTNLNLANAIEITFTGTGATTGGTLNLAFNTVNDFADGIETATQEIRIRSNKTYNVSCKSNSSTFTYTGSVSPAPVMSVWNTLSCMVVSNNTGGTVPLPWTTSSYYSITSVATNMINNGVNGGDKRFQVKYKAVPGFSFPAGTYAVDIVYTASQP